MPDSSSLTDLPRCARAVVAGVEQLALRGRSHVAHFLTDAVSAEA